MSHRETHAHPDANASAVQQATQPAPDTNPPVAAQPRTDGRLAIQAEKLRLNAMNQAVRFGTSKPAMSPRGMGILIGSTLIGALLLGGTVGLSALLQWLMNR